MYLSPNVGGNDRPTDHCRVTDSSAQKICRTVQTQVHCFILGRPDAAMLAALSSAPAALIGD